MSKVPGTRGLLLALAVLAGRIGFTPAPAAEATTAVTPHQTTAQTFATGLAELARGRAGEALCTTIEFTPRETRFVRLLIRKAHAGAACLDELEVYGPGSKTNFALAARGASAEASSVIAGYAIHSVAHLNDGQFGNGRSWIAASEGVEWAQVRFLAPAPVSRVVFSRDRDGRFTDRQVLAAEVLLSLDGQTWETAATLTRGPGELPLPRPNLSFPVAELSGPNWESAVEWAFLRERDTWARMDAGDYLSPLRNDRPAEPGGVPYWGRIARMTPLERVLFQLAEMIKRMEALGLDVSGEQAELASLRDASKRPAAEASDQLFLRARRAKRRLFFRDPTLAPIERVLFAKRHPYQPSHNYSEHLDSLFASGGGICVLRVPRDAEGRFDPALATVETLFDARSGIARDPVADFQAGTIYFAYRPDKPEVAGWQPYWHLMSMRGDGTGLRQMTEGPYHDFDPVPLPDGGLGFMSTRCRSRFLCWEPQAYVLHRMETDGSGLQRLSWANISEWNPAIMRDGRILWTRSEYLDKGADFGHTLWAIRPNGEHPELVFGNDTPYGYGHAREVPGSRELVCTIISHGDHQGPIALIDPGSDRYSTAAITSITPDTPPQYQMDRSHHETFRDPEPVSKDHFLVSHNAGRQSHWGLYVIDRHGNRELLYLDPAISSKRPSPLRERPRPPVLPSTSDPVLAAQGLGQFAVQDVHEGLGSAIPRGRVKYLQVSQEVPAPLEKLACGQYRSSHPSFQDFYATPVHLVTGPRRAYTTLTANAVQPHAFRAGTASQATDGATTVSEHGGWPSYVAKAVLGTVPVAEDGSVSFTAPAGKVLYFHLLDGDYVELQRMRSVVQLQPGERRSCVGCHDNRTSAPSRHPGAAMTGTCQPLSAPPWGAAPFDYERVIQPILDARCVRCHDAKGKSKLDLRGARDAQRVPASYRALIEGGWVDFFDWSYGSRHFKAEPLSFGTVRSRLFAVMERRQHHEIALAPEERRALMAWVDLNCPLWPDYRNRNER